MTTEDDGLLESATAEYAAKNYDRLADEHDAMKRRAEAAEAERDKLRANLEGCIRRNVDVEAERDRAAAEVAVLREELASCDCTTQICPNDGVNLNCTTHRALAQPSPAADALLAERRELRDALEAFLGAHWDIGMHGSGSGVTHRFDGDGAATGCSWCQTKANARALLAKTETTR